MFKFPGKRLTKKPSKFYSPFKHGILSRPPPNLEFSLRMHAFLCADDSPLKRFILISFSSFHSFPSILQNAYWILFKKTLMHFGTGFLFVWQPPMISTWWTPPDSKAEANLFLQCLWCHNCWFELDDDGHQWGTCDQQFVSSQTIDLQVPHSWLVSCITFDRG